MSERFLVDTSVWIEALRSGGQPEITSWLRGALLQETVVIAPPIKTEILLGARNEKQFAELTEMLNALPLLETENAVWERTAFLGFRLRRRGLIIPLIDLLIASWALHHSCILVHCDRHFVLLAKEILELKILSFT